MHMKKKTYIPVLLSLALAVSFLSGCGEKAPETIAAPTTTAAPETTIPTYTVRFFMEDTLLFQQEVASGSLPEEVLPELDGLRFLGWDTEIVPAEADADYHAQVSPILSEHKPYLFPTDGMLHPAADFTAHDLNLALHALASTGAQNYLPEMFGEGAPTAEEVKDFLSGLFPETLEAGFQGVDLSLPLTRAQAAKVFNVLLGRSGEAVTVPEGSFGCLDVSPAHPDYADLCEAAIPHEPGSDSWESIVLPTGCEPGWVVENGKARLFDENGYLVVNTVTEGKMQLDTEGYYTSGNEELDGLVRELLAGFQQENPEADRIALLRMAFEYSRDSFMYLRKDPYEFGLDGWQVEAALIMLNTGHGNCYNYAAVFAALARGLGYEAHAISGTIGSEEYPHSWVEIEFDGMPYLFDPELEMANGPTDPDLRDLFMKSIYFAESYSYHRPELFTMIGDQNES